MQVIRKNMLFMAVALLCLAFRNSALSILKIDGESAVDNNKVFSTNCTMSVNAVKKEIYLLTPEGPMVLSEAGVMMDNKIIGTAPQKAFICEATDTNSIPGSLAILDTSTSTTYLFHGGEGQWDGFVNKHCYAKKHQKGHFLWFGEVTAEASELLKQKEVNAAPCKDGMPSSHYFRPLALKAILDSKPHVGTILNMDLDVWIPASHWNDDIETEFFSDPAHVITGQSSGPRLVSGACVGFKNDPVGREVLGDWFKNRCGKKDQIALWNALFRQFAKEDPNFKYSKGSMSSYGPAMRYAINTAHAYWPDYKGYTSYRNGWTVDAPVHMGKTLLIHPNAKGSKALLYAIGGSYVCHASSKTPARVNADTGCARKYICERSEQCQCL